MIFASYDLFFVCPPERKSVGFHFLRVKFCGQRSVPGIWVVSIFLVVWIRDVRGGLLFRGAGRGGAKVKIHGAGRGEGENPRGGAKKRANQPIQKFYKSAKNIILHIIILIII